MEIREPLNAINTLKKVIKRAMRTGNFPKALAGIDACAELAYRYNQWYTDHELEDWLQDIERELPRTTLTKEGTSRNTVLFYDGFGMDTRGLALVYLKALTALGYHLVYVTTDAAKGNQPEIQKVLSSADCERVFFSARDGHMEKIHALVAAFEQYKPAHAFFYTFPSDVEAVVTFLHYDGVVSRYQINLTDHAFWLGTKALDYCIEFRDYGASISTQYRGIPEGKLRMLPYYPFVDKEVPFAGFPFDTDGKKVLFSGGSLYKTIDQNKTFYKLVRAILEEHPDTLFLYAGAGDDSGLRWLAEQMPGRTYHIAERKDLYQLLRNTCLYINTYPIVGSMMMQYAAAAGTIPITLKKPRDDDADGMLIGQDQLGVVFTEPEALLAEVRHLLSDDAYRAAKGEQLLHSLIGEEEFHQGLSEIMNGNPTVYPMEVKPVDTAVFLENYKNSFSKNDVSEVICVRRRSALWPYFPKEVLRKICGKVGRRLRRR